MQLGSLVGFGFVFVLVAWTCSLALMLAIRACKHRLRRLGPAAERRVVELAAAIPVILGVAVVAVLVLRSHLGVDHCEEHHHHAHLCLWHGAPWSERSWAVALVTVVGGIAFARTAILAVTTLRYRRLIARLRTVSRHEDDIWRIETPHAVCFVAGFREPEIFVSSGAWNALDDDEREAMLAHERAHVLHRDVARRFVVDVLLFAGAPFPSVLRDAWDSATERLCDARAAIDVGGGESVASAMVKVCRLGIQTRWSPANFTPPAVALTDRVNAVLEDQPTGDRAARVVLALVLTALSAVVFIAAIQSGSLHDVLESLLG